MRRDYRFILKVTLLQAKNALMVEIIKWDQKFVYNKEKNEYPYYEDKNNFMLYSYGHGDIYENCFALPDIEHLKKGSTLYYEFISETERYNYVKSLYKCLSEFGHTFYKKEGKETKFRIKNRIWAYR